MRYHTKLDLLIGLLIIVLIMQLFLKPEVDVRQPIFNSDYADGCMQMLAVEYNYTYPMENMTLAKSMESKYDKCMDWWINKRWFDNKEHTIK